MRRPLDLLLPPRPEQRRARLLTTLTIAVGAATIAATSSGNSEVLAANGSATLSGAEIAPSAATSHDRTLVPTTEQSVATSPSTSSRSLSRSVSRGQPSHAQQPSTAPSRLGTIERLSQQQALPSLSADTTSTAADGDGAGGAAAAVATRDDAAPADVPLAYTAADGEVVTPERIFAFLDGRRSPLADSAEIFVTAGIEHDVDPRVVVAIAIAESNGGEMMPPGTHNAWGWGGSGGPRGLRAWDSWEQSIDHYTERLGAMYDTDNVDWDFASTYCPPNTQWWYDTVTWAIGQI